MFICIFKDGKNFHFERKNHRMHSENFTLFLKKLLEESGTNLRDLERVYMTNLSGNQTGIRISITFAISMSVLNPKIKILHIDTLLFQSGGDDCISLMSINEKKTKYFFLLKNGNRMTFRNEIEAEEIDAYKKAFPTLAVRENLEDTNFLDNFRRLKNSFRNLDLENLEC
jgi:tRNA A37 threonylcarbamoyladenosine modification protein TsaB